MEAKLKRDGHGCRTYSDKHCHRAATEQIVAMVLHGVHATAGRHLVYQHDDEVCWTHAIWCHRGGGGGGTGEDEAVDAVGDTEGQRHQAPVHASSTPSADCRTFCYRMSVRAIVFFSFSTVKGI